MQNNHFSGYIFFCTETDSKHQFRDPETDAIDQFLDQTMVTFLYSEIDERIQFLFKESFGCRQTFCFFVLLKM